MSIIRLIASARSAQVEMLTQHGSIRTFRRRKMILFRRKDTARRLLRDRSVRFFCILLFTMVLAGNGQAQEVPARHWGVVIPLADLLQEAEKNNPQIEAARQSWQAAKQAPTQVSTLPDPQFNLQQFSVGSVSTLPDPQFNLQQFSVGSPRPFAGYTNSNFAYVALGVSQDIPYPGKLKLRGEIAKREADVSQQQVEFIRRAVLAEVEASYFQLAYLSKTLAILESDGELLKQVEQASDARYRSGMGMQQDVLRTQLQKTKLVQEIAMHHLEVGRLEARLKQLLSRSQGSPDIESADLVETPLVQSYD